jgi:hypothetical protein
VQRLKINSRFTFDAEFIDSRLEAPLGKFLETFLRFPSLNNPKSGVRRVRNMLVDSRFGMCFYSHLIQYRPEFSVG